MKSFTLGFIFDPELKRVALIEKQRPDWQRGHYNGVGGKIEPGETSIACIVREVREESGLTTTEGDWTHVASLSADDWAMDVYAHVHAGAAEDIRTLTDEQVSWHEVRSLPELALTNVPWLVHLCKDKMQTNAFERCVVTYSGDKKSV